MHGYICTYAIGILGFLLYNNKFCYLTIIKYILLNKYNIHKQKSSVIGNLRHSFRT